MQGFRCIYACTMVGAVFAADVVFADTVTIGPNGINSAGLTDFNGDPLTVAGISIGQVEAQRPGKPGFDNTNSNFGTIPQEVFLLDDRVSPTADAMDEIFAPGDPPAVPPFAHATWIAGVMIGKDAAAPGVAQDANLYASDGDYPTTPALAPLDALAITSQFIATRDNDNVRAINLSFTVSFEPHDDRIKMPPNSGKSGLITDRRTTKLNHRTKVETNRPVIALLLRIGASL